jgi:1-acyl-sn-glycerol-3-phosphate acyltransferase
VEIRRVFVTYVLKTILDFLCKIECSEYVKTLSKSKPMIIAFNHTNFLEVPILATHGYPKIVTGIAKAETWNNTFFSFLFNTFQAIPIERGNAFKGISKKVKKLTDKGFYVSIAPEGTRSKNGILRNGKSGIIHLAYETNLPIMPVAHYGGENIWKNIKRFRRTPFYLKAGQPFMIKFNGRPEKGVRDEMLGEVMGQLARLLPQDKRGCYAEQARLETKYLEFLT